MLRPLLTLTLLATPAVAQLPVVERVSVSTAGAQGDQGATVDPRLSADGRYVVFESRATNLVANDTNGQPDVFHHDRLTGITIRCSIGSGGEQADDVSSGPAISGDGRWVAFWTYSDALDAADTNGLRDVYLHDTVTRTTERISVGLAGAEPDGYAAWPSVNQDGTRVAFSSAATNLAHGDTNSITDIFLRDRVAGTTTVVSRTLTGGAPNGFSSRPYLSADGRYVAYYTTSTNMGSGDLSSDHDVYLHDTVTSGTVQVSVDHAGGQISGSCLHGPISRDGSLVAFSANSFQVTPDDTNGEGDIFVRDLKAGTLTLVSKSSDGQLTTFHSNHGPSLSADGRYVSWWTRSSKFLASDTNGMVDQLVHDRWSGITELVTSRSDGSMANGENNTGHLSADGRYVAYLSTSTNLVPGDTNGQHDIFVVDRRLGGLQLWVNGDQAGSPAVLHLREGSAGAHVGVTWSLGAQHLSGTTFGLLSQPVTHNALGFGLDAGGGLQKVIGLPPSLLGQTLWLQAIDGTTGLLSNSYRIEVQ